MAQVPCIGLSWPLTKPPFGSCAIYFHYGVTVLDGTRNPKSINRRSFSAKAANQIRKNGMHSLTWQDRSWQLPKSCAKLIGILSFFTITCLIWQNKNKNVVPRPTTLNSVFPQELTQTPFVSTVVDLNLASS